MPAWTNEELTRIGTATELQIAMSRRDGERIVGGVVNPRARAATSKLVPR